MTQKQIIKHRHVIEGFMLGKTIQLQMVGGNWVDCQNPEFYFEEEYRIKPSPKIRPWHAHEVPVGALFRWPESLSPGRHPLVITERVNTAFMVGSKGCCVMRSEACHKEGEYSMNGGETWHRCGVEEEG